MGLDMYLNRCDRRDWGFRDIDIYEAKEDKPKLYEAIKPYLHKRGSEYYSWESIFEDVGYWRKANAIHRWFVENVQDGEDDCGYYEVSKEQLEELLKTCIEVRDLSKLEQGWVKNGEIFKNGMWCPCMEEGEYIINPEIAEELLPTTSGFFFGSTNYDQWYMENIVDTIDILTKVLETTDFDVDMIVYGSSW
jgi:hypothetical protein